MDAGSDWENQTHIQEGIAPPEYVVLIFWVQHTVILIARRLEYPS